jgi:hypothetical protein
MKLDGNEFADDRYRAGWLRYFLYYALGIIRPKHTPRPRMAAPAASRSETEPAGRRPAWVATPTPNKRVSRGIVPANAPSVPAPPAEGGLRASHLDRIRAMTMLVLTSVTTCGAGRRRYNDGRTKQCQKLPPTQPASPSAPFETSGWLHQAGKPSG